MHISCAIDDSYAYPLAVLLVSLFENHKGEPIKFHLCSASFSEENIKKIEALVCKRYQQQFAFYPLNPKDFENFKLVDRFSIATYYRLLVADTIDTNVDRFLHLDADMIVVGKINDLFTIDLGDKIFGAANDITAIDWRLHRKYNIPDEYLYFNSGALLVDRKKWVDFNVTSKTIDCLMGNMEIYDYVDQDALNNSMFKYRYRIPAKYDQQIGMYFVDITRLNVPFREDYLEAVSNPSIVHFNGMEKPWYYYSGHPYTGEFRKYANLVTEIEPIHTKKKFRKWVKKNIFYRIFGWKLLNRYYYYKTKPEFN
jgi:lipopolysaccharide biosynthesis glycosyltransferase